MSGTVLLVVLLGAFCHASWNAVIKRTGDKFFSAVGLGQVGFLIALLGLPFVPLPPATAFVYIIGSVLMQALYMVLLAACYKAGDMSETYPIMRGTPPLIIAMISAPLLGEAIGLMSWLGIIIICMGVLSMALEARQRNGGGSYRSILLALLTALVIAACAIIDGLGARLAGNAIAYTLWLFAISWIPLSAWVLVREPERFIHHMTTYWRAMLIGGIGAVGAYTTILWAMTMAPIAIVSAVRETAILFAMLISVVILKEKVGLYRGLAAVLIVIGALVLRLA
ncbi:EamA family transporter [Daeguia caeni]|uniref:EamA family transporter n=1 Tax=Daeguia caeni TaxID=439612 RepID=A0ABV9H1A1_9HYPH